jgi:integrase
MGMKRPRPFAVGRVRVRVIRGPNADGLWYWRAEVHESRRTVWTGWSSAADAERTVAGLVAAGLPSEEPEEDEWACETIFDLLDLWMGAEEKRPDLADSTKSLRKVSATKVDGAIGHVRLEAAGQATWEHLRDARLRAGAAPSTVRLDFQVLRMAWHWGEAHGLVKGRAPKVRVVGEGVRNKYTPPHEEVMAVLEDMRQNCRLVWPTVVLELLVSTGMRVGEAAALHWDQVDVARRCITIRIGKTGRREVAVPESLCETLEAWRAQRGEALTLFATTNGKLLNRSFRHHIERAVARLGLRMWSSHALRRYVVNRYYEAHVDVGVVASQLGQSPATALAYYRKATEEDRRRAVALASLGTAEPKVISIDHARAQLSRTGGEGA